MTPQQQDKIQTLIDQLKAAVNQDPDGVLVLAVQTTNLNDTQCYVEDRVMSGRSDRLLTALENLKLDLTESDD